MADEQKPSPVMPLVITGEVSHATLEQNSVVQAVCVCDRGRSFIARKASARQNALDLIFKLQ
jgi:hypothetical protein